MNLVFNEEEHRYYLDGEELPSATRILDIIPKEDGSPLRDSDGFWLSEDGVASMHQSGDHGTLVHNSLEDFFNGKSEDDIMRDVNKKDQELSQD